MVRCHRLSLPAAILVAAFAGPLQAQRLHIEVAGAAAGDHFGQAVAWAGDLDGDQVPDFLVGAPLSDLNGVQSGAVLALSGADGRTLFQFTGDAPAHQLGAVVAGPGDVNGDGVPDLLAGARRDNGNGFPTGYARVWSGLDGSVLYTFQSASRWDDFAAAAAGAGDVNGDGRADLVIGAPEDDWSGPGSGSAYVYSGLDGSLLHTLHGTEPWALYGYSVAGAGDMDGDGYDDFAVGSPLEDSRRTDTGAVQVHSGRTGAVIHRLLGRFAHDSFGTALDGGRDIDLDGVPDLLVGGVRFLSAPERDGWVRAISGADGSFLVTLNAAHLVDAFGWCVGLGDVNGDSAADLLVGLPYAGAIGQTALGAGAMEIYSGGNHRLLVRLDGSSTLELLGSAVAGGTDLDADGFEDWLVGLPGASASAGAVRVYLAEALPRLQLQNPVAGQTATLQTTGGAAGARVDFFLSLVGFGTAPFPGVAGLTSDLAGPLKPLGSAVADPAGTASLPAQVPAGAAGRRVFLQAAERSTSGPWRASTVAVPDIR